MKKKWRSKSTRRPLFFLLRQHLHCDAFYSVNLQNEASHLQFYRHLKTEDLLLSQIIYLFSLKKTYFPCLLFLATCIETQICSIHKKTSQMDEKSDFFCGGKPKKSFLWKVARLKNAVEQQNVNGLNELSSSAPQLLSPSSSNPFPLSASSWPFKLSKAE